MKLNFSEKMIEGKSSSDEKVFIHLTMSSALHFERDSPM